MKRLRPLLASILIALTLLLSAVSLRANGSEIFQLKRNNVVEPSNSRIPKESGSPKASPSKTQEHDSGTTAEKASTKQPVAVEIIESPYLDKSAKQDEANKEANLKVQREISGYTFVLAIFAVVQAFVLIAQVCFNA